MMDHIDIEIWERKKVGQALAGRFENCRVYRGNGSVDVIGTPFDADEAAEVSKLVDQIKAKSGHIGWHGVKLKLKPPSAKATQ
jgi:hypothetical protein